jgi:hypothetical protein
VPSRVVDTLAQPAPHHRLPRQLCERLGSRSPPSLNPGARDKAQVWQSAAGLLDGLWGGL